VAKAVWEYGHNMGLAYQLMHDLIMHDVSELHAVAPQDSSSLFEDELSLRVRKCVNTPPFHFAAQEYTDEVLAMTSRGLQNATDVARVEEMVEAVGGESRTRAMALDHAQKAIDALGTLPESTERSALILLAHYAVSEGQKELQRPEFNARTSKSKMFS